MPYGWLANAVLLAHFGFVVFVIIGGVAVLRWPRVAWVHLPAVIWAALIEYADWICPLTPLENTLRQAGGEAAYSGGFIDRYIGSIVYPTGLTRGVQVVLGSLLLLLNTFVYWRLLRKKARRN